MSDGSPHPRQSDITTRGRIARLPTADRRRPLTMVLGMHRSGTSLCSHMLSLLGVDMTDKIAGPGHEVPAFDNPQGHWERWEIVAFHDRILHLFNREYNTAFHDFALPVAWWADPEVAKIRCEIVDFIGNRMGEAPFGFKDPRTVRLMPLWYQIASELDLAPRFVFCVRAPAQVARSLHQRERLPMEVGEYRWLVHMIDFFRYVGDRPFCAIEYGTWFTDPAANVEKLQAFLGLEWQQSQLDLDLAVAGIVNPGLRHDDRGLPAARQPLVRSLYHLIERAEQDAAAREQIRQIATQFISFQQLQLPFARAYEATEAKLATAEGQIAKLPEAQARLSQVSVELNELTARLAEVEGQRDARAADHDAAIAEAQKRAAAIESQLAEAVTDAGEQRARLAGMETDREAQVAALTAAETSAAGLRDLLSERDAALASASADWHMKAEEARAAAEALQQRLIAIERERDDGAAALAALEASAVDLLAAIESGRAALARAAAAAAEAQGKLAQALTEKDAIASNLAAAERECKELQAGTARAEATAADLQARLTFHATAQQDAEEQLARAVDVHTSALAEAEQRRQQERTAADNEISRLQDAFAIAQGQADRRSASIVAMLREISSLRQNITAARSVSAVLVGTFRDNTAPLATHHDGDRRWIPPWLRRLWLG